MKVYLVGYMGVGKTTLGKKLASRLNLPFIDLDSEIESRQGMDIPEIFTKQGEEAFRIMESQCLRDISKEKDSFLLSTGGGAPVTSGNMDFMLGAGVVVWLKMPLTMIAKRLKQASEDRPLLRDVPETNYEQFISNHIQERIPFYSQAQIHFPASQNDAASLDILAKEIADYSR